MNRVAWAITATLCLSGCSSESGDGTTAGGGGTSTSSSSTITSSPEAATGPSSTADSSSASAAGGGSGDGGAGGQGGTGAGGSSSGSGIGGEGGTGGASPDPSVCALQLTEEDCHAAGCNAWSIYFDLTVIGDGQCTTENIGPLCMHYSNPQGSAAYGAFARTFDADRPAVLGDSSSAVPDGWVPCGEPGSEGLLECCCYGDFFGDGTCQDI